MDFAFTEEQQMIRETAESFLNEASGSASVRVAMLSERGYEPALWQRICDEMLWQAIHIPEQYNGVGLGYIELVSVLEKTGAALLCSPFYATTSLGVNTLLISGSEEQKAEYLPKFAMGETATLAYTGEAASNYGGQWGSEAIQVTSAKDGDQFVLNGNLRYVPDGATADYLFIAARDEGSLVSPPAEGSLINALAEGSSKNEPAEGCDDHSISLFMVRADHDGISSSALPTIDQTRRLATITLDNVMLSRCALLGEQGQAWKHLSSVIDLGNISLAAEQLGGAQRVLDMAVGYSKQRFQFGRSIASFQAIKHMAADMMLRVESARSAVYYAACIAQQFFEQEDDISAADLAEAASIAKSYCSDAYFKNASDALQIHGGVGFTWEYDIHLYLKRAKASQHFLGHSSYHYEQLAKQLLDGGETA